METNYQQIADQAAIELDEDLTAAAYPQEPEAVASNNSIYNFNAILDGILEE